MGLAFDRTHLFEPYHKGIIYMNPNGIRCSMFGVFDKGQLEKINGDELKRTSKDMCSENVYTYGIYMKFM
jgi:hypothetical protein